LTHQTLVVLLFIVLAVAAAPAADSADLDPLIEQQLPSLGEIYKRLHQAPELSHHEVKTSAFLAGQLRSLGFEVTERVGKYTNPSLTSYGVVAVMHNGQGRTIMVRTDLDALPVKEETGLLYASTVHAKDDAGQDVSVMHACGHDIHITTMIGTARMLVQLKNQWHGTLLLIGQPAEEMIDGARAMLADDLYTRFPRPDYCVALHDSADLPAGKVGYCPGYSMASSTTVEITIRGKGGHGSRPEATKDPIVLAAQVVLALQTIVSREISPLDPAVVTVGSIHGGTKANIIPDEVKMWLTVRAYKEEVRQKILASIQTICDGIAKAAGVPPDRAPIVKVSDTEVTPATYNDPALTERLAAVFKRALGTDNVEQTNPVMGSEDFGRFGLEGHQIPICMFTIGAVDPAIYARAKQEGTILPSLHSSRFAPLPEPTLRTGVKAMTSAVLDLLGQ
jgi:amidohydrolase